MHFYGALILFMTLSAAYGLKCHTCVGGIGCSAVMTCPSGLNRCFSVEVLGLTKSCMTSEACVEPIKCCSQDLCNSAMPAGSSPLLLLLSSASITVFL
ncbi:lymphocyte antigen 6D-like [Trematomus bernacchii]|uniref:lymphocyte antigen 6D-like n=1 Tax=Trematomus bernacchii TaxID=40690 RepID=UPI00146E8821|nr:lymphocyte antigen 6D-like [Trematomus bernacchii]